MQPHILIGKKKSVNNVHILSTFSRFETPLGKTYTNT